MGIGLAASLTPELTPAVSGFVRSAVDLAAALVLLAGVAAGLFRDQRLTHRRLGIGRVMRIVGVTHEIYYASPDSDPEPTIVSLVEMSFGLLW